VDIQLRFKSKRKRDIDNALKPLLDCLQDAGVLENDHLILFCLSLSLQYSIALVFLLHVGLCEYHCFFESERLYSSVGDKSITDFSLVGLYKPSQK